MKNSVEIVGRGWKQHLPTGTGYDREVLLDHLREAVQIHGTARLVWSSGSASVARSSRQSTKKCTSCHGLVRQIVGTSGRDLLCMSCLWQRARKQVRRLPHLATVG